MLDSHFTPLLIIVFLAFIVPIILSRFKQLRLPIVVGEILVGIIIGRSGFQLNLPGDILVLALRRDGELFVPHGNTSIEECDHLSLVSSCEWVETGRMLFSEM